MRIMGLDVGNKTIGVAVSDLLGIIANGVETIGRTAEAKDYSRIAQLVEKYEVDSIVVGYPKNMNGTVGESGLACEAFAEKLRQVLPTVKIVLWDERLSTAAAEKVLIEADLRRKKRRQVIDMMAAVVILQNYLDSRQFNTSR